MDSYRILIDPLGRRRCAKLGSFEAILITHAHIDHLNRWTLSRLDKGAQLFVPKGAKRYVADLGFSKVTEVEPGDQWAVGRLDIVAVPTRHDPGRWRKHHDVGCTGYVISKNGVCVHHAGDVDMSDFAVFEDIGKDYPIDATMLPIGGMLPVWYYRMRQKALDRGIHIDPDTALAVADRLGATTMIPIHWGTVHLRLGPKTAPRSRLVKVAKMTGKTDLVQILEHGEKWTLKNPED